MTQQEEPLWIVKTSGRVIGPLTQSKVKQLLLSKEIVPLDEACKPRRRWQYLRDLKEYTEVLEELRVQQIRASSDNTQTSRMQGDELTASVTANLGYNATDELTGDVEPINFEVTQDIPISDLGDMDEDGDSSDSSFRDVTSTGTTEAGSKAEKYVSSDDAQKSVKSFSYQIWKFTIVIVLITAGFLLSNQFLLKPQKEKSTSRDALTTAEALYFVGKYRDALKYYDVALGHGVENKEPYVRYGTLLIQLDRDTVKGKRILSEALEFDQRNKVYVLAGLGLANILNGEYIFAKKNFEEVLELEPNQTAAIINLGWLLLREGNLDAAIKYFGSAIIKRSGEIDNSAYIYLSKALISKWVNSGNIKNLMEAKNNLLTIVDGKTDYRQEGLFLLTYIYSQLKETENYFRTIESLLDTDPELTENHAHDLFVYHDGISWAAFAPLCEEIYKKQKGDATAVALSGYCALKGNQLKRADERFVELANKRTQNPLLLAHHAYYYQKTGNDNHAAVTLGKAAKNNRGKEYILPLMLEARNCQELGDEECSLKLWNEILSKDENSIQALTNIAAIQVKNRQLKNGENYIRRALSISDKYTPAKYVEAQIYEAKNK